MKIKEPRGILSYEFDYDGITRVVDNVELENELETMIGFEVRKGGKYSYQVKRYKLHKIDNLKLLPPVKRSGPKIGRPERKP